MRNLLYISLLASAALIAGCSSNNDDNATPSGGGGTGGGGGGGTTLTLYTPCSVQMTVNGTAVAYAQDGNLYDCLSGSGGSADSKSYHAGLASDTGNPINVELGKFNTGLSVGMPTDSAFFSFIHFGAWTYGNAETELNKVTVSIYEDGTEYSSAYGSQTGSNFQIVDTLKFTPQFQYAIIKTRVTFNCKLYTSGGGLAKTITNGTAVIGFENY